MSFLSTDVEINALLDQIPILAGPRQVEELSGGLTNRNFKVTNAAGAFVARCTDTSCNLLGIDREAEYVNTRAAERAGVGAPVIDYRPELGVLLLGFLDGATLANADFQRPDVLAMAAASCRALHAGPRFQGDFDMFERQPSYLKTVQDNGFKMPADYLRHADKFAEIKSALRATDRTAVPCNNDLLAANFVEDGNKLWIIDYEYSGNNDPCFELGNIWSECGLSLDQLEELVTAYYGRRLRHKIARARLQGIVAKYGWTLWGCIQHSSCAIDYDFWGWALERYEPAVEEFNGPDFNRLLSDVTASD
ncbi:MAG: choline/ethanolamine kinase family protein [Mycobacterium sp.]